MGWLVVPTSHHVLPVWRDVKEELIVERVLLIQGVHIFLHIVSNLGGEQGFVVRCAPEVPELYTQVISTHYLIRVVQETRTRYIVQKSVVLVHLPFIRYRGAELLARSGREIWLLAEIADVDHSFARCIQEDATTARPVEGRTRDELIRFVWVKVDEVEHRAFVAELEVTQPDAGFIGWQEVFPIRRQGKRVNVVLLAGLKCVNKFLLSYWFSSTRLRDCKTLSIF